MLKVRVRSCDWCNRDIQVSGKNADPYIINAERKIFCKVHYPGHEPERDCMDEYLKNSRRKRNDKISYKTKLKEEKEEKEEEKKIVAFRPVAIQKLEALQKHFKNSPTKSSYL
jgi:uncharacterized membrane protein